VNREPYRWTTSHAEARSRGEDHDRLWRHGGVAADPKSLPLESWMEERCAGARCSTREQSSAAPRTSASSAPKIVAQRRLDATRPQRESSNGPSVLSPSPPSTPRRSVACPAPARPATVLRHSHPASPKTDGAGVRPAAMLPLNYRHTMSYAERGPWRRSCLYRSRFAVRTSPSTL